MVYCTTLRSSYKNRLDFPFKLKPVAVIVCHLTLAALYPGAFPLGHVRYGSMYCTNFMRAVAERHGDYIMLDNDDDFEAFSEVSRHV